MTIVGKINKLTSFSNISKKFLKAISREGINLFPTIMVLINRFFLSDKKNIGKSLNLTYKLKEGDNVYWLRGEKIPNGSFSNFLKTEKYIIDILKRNINFFKKYTENPNLIGINKVFDCGTKVFVIRNNSLFYGDNLKNSSKSITINNFNYNDIKKIVPLNDKVYLILYNKGFYFYDVTKNVLSKEYMKANNYYTLTDICVVNNSIVVTTDREGFYILTSTHFNSNFNSDIFSKPDFSFEMKNGRFYNWTIYVITGQDPEGGSTGYYITVDNGLPTGNNYSAVHPNSNNSFIVVSGNQGYMIPLSKALTDGFEHNNTHGEREPRYEHHSLGNYASGFESRYIGSNYYMWGNNLVQTKYGACSTENNEKPKVLLRSKNLYETAVYGNRIKMFEFGSIWTKEYFTLKNENFIPNNITYAYIDENDLLYFFDNSGNAYVNITDPSEFTNDKIEIVSIRFEWDRDWKVVDETDRCDSMTKILPLYDFIKMIVNDKLVFNDKRSDFLFAINRNGSKLNLLAFGDDDRYENEMKNIYGGFGISV